MLIMRSFFFRIGYHEQISHTKEATGTFKTSKPPHDLHRNWRQTRTGVEKKNQLDASEWFIALIICSTCSGHFYGHHQELETMCVTAAYGVQCLVAGCRESGAGQQAMRPGRWMLHDESYNIPHPGRIACCPAPDLQQPATKASHNMGGNNTHIVSRSWWWTQKCPKHVEHIISAINHSVASSWFFFFLLYAYATMHGQTHIKFVICLGT